MKTCLIGIGNILRRDDGVGIEIVKSLRGAGLESIHTGDSYLLENDLFSLPAIIHNYDRSLIIDALPPGPEPGKIYLTRRQGPLLPAQTYSLHDMDLIWQLTYAQNSGYKGEVFIAAIETYCVDMGLGLSPQIKSAYAGIQKEIKAILKNIISPTYLRANESNRTRR